MRVLLVCVGRVREPFADDSAHYERLLGRYTSIETIELKEAGTQMAQARQAMASEAAQIERRIPDRAFVCALDRGGRQRSSEEMAEFLEQRRASGQDLCLLIGGPFGLDPSLLRRADAAISLGKITLPRQLARVVVLEQLFRAHKILLGEPYHY